MEEAVEGMSTWQGAWYLAKHEMKRARWKHLLTVVFIAYLVIFLVPMFSNAIKGEAEIPINWTVDFLTITLVPLLGLMAFQSKAFYWRTDVYTQKLAYWRTLPITAGQIARGKLLAYLVNALPAQTLFYLIYYLGIRTLTDQIDPVTFALHSAFWIGIGFCTAMMYLYSEVSMSGKAYFIVCLLVVIVVLLCAILYTAVTHKSLVYDSYMAIDSGAWYLPLASLAVAAVTVALTVGRMEKRIRTRSYGS